ncbi:MAG: RNA polymerase factor sigma-32 [Sandaracinaceae bacterium]|nr:RNA polymerase factor sigma-32 [Sandaracinaceae bacterium]
MLSALARPTVDPDDDEDELIDDDDAEDGDDASGRADDADGEDGDDADLEDGEDGEPDDDEVVEAEIVDEAEAVGALPVRVAKGRAKGASVARTDPLQAYMRDVSRYPLLTREEEHELAVHYTETGDVEAAARLVTANLRLVVKIAYDYRRAYKNLLDLIQEGNIGLMRAVKKYDPYKGVKLSSYAAWWIRAYILRFILSNHRLVKLGTTQAQRKLFFNLKKEKAKLAAMGIEPTADLIAKRLEVTSKEVTQMERRLGGGEMSLDAPVSAGADGRPTARVELMPSPGERVDDWLANEEVSRMLTDKIHEYGETLDGKEAIIFRDRLVAEDPRTLQDLGDEFGVSRERVRQIEKRLQGKLKKFLQKEVGEPVLP